MGSKDSTRMDKNGYVSIQGEALGDLGYGSNLMVPTNLVHIAYGPGTYTRGQTIPTKTNIQASFGTNNLTLQKKCLDRLEAIHGIYRVDSTHTDHPQIQFV